MKNELISNEKAIADSINLRFGTREELEQGRSDYVRFSLITDYPNEVSLRYFQDSTLQWLFRELYHRPTPPNVDVLLTEALRRSHDSPRVKQVIDKIRSQLLSGDK